LSIPDNISASGDTNVSGGWEMVGTTAGLHRPVRRCRGLVQGKFTGNKTREKRSVAVFSVMRMVKIVG
jgi:hypothetical protein